MKPIFVLFAAALTLLLQSCSTAPAVPSKPSSPIELAPLSLPVPERDWQGRMQSFLQGNLPPPLNNNHD